MTVIAPSRKYRGGAEFVRQKSISRPLLRGVTFEVKTNDRIALVGSNGAGKSTLVRTLAGIINPKQGYVYGTENTIPYFSASVGMSLSSTGRTNSILQFRLLGLPSERIVELVEGVRDFSELGDYFDMPMNTYSRGMVGRLSISVKIIELREIINSNKILLIDEALSAGDQAFVKKASKEMVRLLDKTSLVLVSHSAEMLKMFCSKAVFLKDGEIAASGEINNILDQYKNN